MEVDYNSLKFDFVTSEAVKLPDKQSFLAMPSRASRTLTNETSYKQLQKG